MPKSATANRANPVKRANPEQKFHGAVARYLETALPEHAIWTTFPAGGGGMMRGRILHGLGLRAGWPDIQILVRMNGFDANASASRFIGLELKALKGAVSGAQEVCHVGIARAGGIVYIVRTLEDVWRVLTENEHLRLKARPM